MQPGVPAAGRSLPRFGSLSGLCGQICHNASRPSQVRQTIAAVTHLPSSTNVDVRLVERSRDRSIEAAAAGIGVRRVTCRSCRSPAYCQIAAPRSFGVSTPTWARDTRFARRRGCSRRLCPARRPTMSACATACTASRMRLKRTKRLRRWRPPSPLTDDDAEIVVMIDGAHIRAVPGHQSRRLDVTVGKVETAGRPPRRFALAPMGAEQPAQAIRAALIEQGWRLGRPVTVISDGEPAPPNLVCAAKEGPVSHILDWWHISMRVRVTSSRRWPASTRCGRRTKPDSTTSART